MKTYTKAQFAADIVAGVIVAIIALPLSIALAVASGVEPQQGLYTSVATAMDVPHWKSKAVHPARSLSAVTTTIRPSFNSAPALPISGTTPIAYS